MNFDLAEEQRILKSAARNFLAKECPKEVVRRIKESEEGYSRDLWGKMAELGWMGVLFPEEYEGFGGSFLDLVLLAEEMGYHVCPSPFLPTVVLGCLPILLAGSEDQKRRFLPAVSRGEKILTMALVEPNTGQEVTLPSVNAVSDGGEYVLNATKLFVPYAHMADCFLCVTRTREGHDAQEGLTIFLVDAKAPGIRLTPLDTLENDKQFEVVLDRVRVPQENILGGVDRGGPVVGDVLTKAAVARAAEMVGGAQAAMEMAMQYAKERVQFDRPIGSFQLVQHHFARMWIDIHGARYLVFKAAWKISRGLPGGIEASMAKDHAGRVCRRVTTLGHQIFAAVSFTMEHDMHFYYRQAMGGDLAFGNSDHHRTVVGRELCLSDSPPPGPLVPLS